MYTSNGGRVMALDLESRDTTELLADAAWARWVPGGYLVYGATPGDEIRAVGFDPDRLQLAGSPVPVRDDVNTRNTIAVNAGGTLAFLRGAIPGDWTFSLMDEAGNREVLPIAPSDHWDIAVSPDGLSVAYTREDDIWIFDLDRGGSFALTEGRTGRHNPVWSPDGARIVFSSPDGPRVRPIDRSAEPHWCRALRSGTTRSSGSTTARFSWTRTGTLLRHGRTRERRACSSKPPGRREARRCRPMAGGWRTSAIAAVRFSSTSGAGPA